MPRTPNPSRATLLGQMPLVVPNMPVILPELLARLRVDFPEALAALDQTLKPPKTVDDYRLAPSEPLGDGYAHTVLVGNDLDFETGGARLFFGGSTLQIFIVEEKRRTGFKILDYWKQIAAMASAMFTYLTCCVDDDGVNMWKLLLPQTVEGLPEQYASAYHGVMLTYRMEFTPQSSGWPQSLSGANQ